MRIVARLCESFSGGTVAIDLPPPNEPNSFSSNACRGADDATTCYPSLGWGDVHPSRLCAILDAIGASAVQQGRKKQFDVSILQAGLGRNSCNWSVRRSTGEKSFHMQINAFLQSNLTT